MIKGIDVGYAYTKDDEKRIFKSAISKDNILSNAPKVRIDGEVYYVGRGVSTVEADKTDSLINKVCLLTMIGMGRGLDYYLVTGLPIGQYATQKDKLREAILKMRRNTIEINGTERTFNIHDVSIFPQAAGALYSQRIEGDVIIVDIGGRTIDVAEIEIKGANANLQRYNTYYKGVLVLYSSIISAINSRFDLTLEARYAEKILKEGLCIEGVPQDIDFLLPTIKEFFEPVFQSLSLDYATRTTKMYLCGGGSVLFGNAFKKRFVDVEIIKDPQFANAMGFRVVGEKIYGQYENKGGGRAWQNT